MTRKYMNPILRKVPDFLKIAVFLAKTVKKPILPRLIAFKNSRKHKKVSLLQHYGYGYVKEYQFSPSRSPLMSYYKKRSYKEMCSVLYVYNCLGKFEEDHRADEMCDYPMELNLRALPKKEAMEYADSGGEEEEEDDSVDERAERFIERFYEEIRLQKKEPFLQLGGIN
ncbi:hypothetical protein ACET3Z_032014 [Daucus carota]